MSEPTRQRNIDQILTVCGWIAGLVLVAGALAAGSFVSSAAFSGRLGGWLVLAVFAAAPVLFGLWLFKLLSPPRE